MTLTYEDSFDHILSIIHNNNSHCNECPLNIRFTSNTGEVRSYCYWMYIREDPIVIGHINSKFYPQPPTKDVMIKRIMTKYKNIINLSE